CLQSKTTRLLHNRRALTFPCFVNDPTPTEIYPLSLHDALPIYARPPGKSFPPGGCTRLKYTSMCCSSPPTTTGALAIADSVQPRSEEHTSELQSQSNLVCRLLLEKKKHT